MATGVVSGWTKNDTDLFWHDFQSFHALQETDNWTTSAMNVPRNISYGCDHGTTAILCPRQIIFADHGLMMRCTAILVGPSMLLSVSVPEDGIH